MRPLCRRSSAIALGAGRACTVDPGDDWVEATGDVNGDGFDDVLVGDHEWSGSFLSEGRVKLHLGGHGGLSPTPAWTVTGGAAGMYLGGDLRHGDFNGDGFDDIVISTTNTPSGGRVYYGRPGRPPSTPDWELFSVPGADLWLLEGGGSVGDINGDGYDDLAYTVRRADPMWWTYIHRGGPTGLERTPWIRIEGGPFVAGVGDLNGDGIEDLAVGSENLTHTRFWDFTGRVDLIYGSRDFAGDDDGDGANNLEDCGDDDPARHPGAEELWSDGIDQDCDGSDRYFLIMQADPIDVPYTVWFNGWGDVAGATVHVFASTSPAVIGAGPCSPSNPAICLDLDQPHHLASRTFPSGHTRQPWGFELHIPPALSDRNLWFQMTLAAANGTAATSRVQYAWVSEP